MTDSACERLISNVSNIDLYSGSHDAPAPGSCPVPIVWLIKGMNARGRPEWHEMGYDGME